MEQIGAAGSILLCDVDAEMEQEQIDSNSMKKTEAEFSLLSIGGLPIATDFSPI